jgi:SOS-response transcriptional repressor LexA
MSRGTVKIGKQLAIIRKRLDVTQADIADAIGTSPSAVLHWENNKFEISPKNLEKLCLALNCKPEHLTGEVPIPDDLPIKLFQSIKTQPIRMVPVVSWAKAGHASDYSDLCNQLDEMVPTFSQDPNAFALILEGDSMQPNFQAGDRVVFEPNSQPRTGDYVVARLAESFGVYFKKLRFTGDEGRKVQLISTNSDYKTLEYDATAFSFLYPAVDYFKKLRL